MRIRYEPGLAVSHQYHSKVHPNQERNQIIWKTKSHAYRHDLHHTTAYKPAVGVLIATLKRPHYIDQVMRAVFRTRIPLKVRLVNQGDNSRKQMKALKWWRGRWAMDVIDHSEPKRLSEVRTNAMKAFAEASYKYMVTIDDDVLPKPRSIETLLRALEENPQYYAIAGGIIQKRMDRMLGGYIIPEEDHQYYVLPLIKGIAEVDYISSGFTAFRLDPYVPYDTEYEFGWNDWDWSKETKEQDLRLAVCGDAMAYHKHLITSKAIKPHHDDYDYLMLRGNQKRITASTCRFHTKWGYFPRPAENWNKPVLEGLP